MLPPPMAEVTVPDCFSPSALGSSGGCRLKLAIMSLPRSGWTERLATGPDAVVGALLHRVLERAARNAGSSPDEIFREEYERAVNEVQQDPRRVHFAELASMWSMAEWNRVKSWVLARASRERPPTGTRGAPSRGERTLIGPEIGLKSTTLRLRGKADRIRQPSPGVFEVRDFKTGATLDEHGDVKAEMVLQLRAYGLMVLERSPGATVRLVVDDGEEREVPFDVEAQRDTEAALRQIVDAMPAPGSARAEALAVPGKACWGCSIRHVCPGYRAIAPEWWKEYPAGIERLSNDTWGTVLEIFGERQPDVVLRDEAGRRVRVDGVGSRHSITNALVGKRIWFFGLEATGATRGFDGARYHPRCFHEHPRDSLERRACTLHAFVEDGAGDTAAFVTET